MLSTRIKPKEQPMATTPTATKTPRKRAAPSRAVPATTTDQSDADTGSETTVSKVRQQASTLIGEAGDAARKAASGGKDKAAEALGGVARMTEEAAKSIDQHLGAQYGDYARKASASVTKAADSLNAKDVDAIVEDVKQVVRKNPVAAVGIAAAFGFLLTRIARIGSRD
jgi:ElaB/YqjD/DUF883 family membrane-anchored ribosome-binding protein